MIDPVYGPIVSLSAATSAGVGTAANPEGPLPNWTAQLATSGSTSTITVAWRVVGRLSTSLSWITLSTGVGAGVLNVADKPYRYMAVELVSISSTSSTAPAATAWITGSL